MNMNMKMNQTIYATARNLINMSQGWLPDYDIYYLLILLLSGKR